MQVQSSSRVDRMLSVTATIIIHEKVRQGKGLYRKNQLSAGLSFDRYCFCLKLQLIVRNRDDDFLKEVAAYGW